MQKETHSLKLLQFYADWCQPCQMMMPIVASIKGKEYDFLDILQYNVDEEAFLSQKYNIRSIPTVVVLKNNEEVWRYTGPMRASELKEILLSLR
ncbi:thioredoxin family protein [Sphingobacterium faecale]|uniref:Thioredoxin family protein n=1 Tax=Sphingobacterium faecale TaxID=2803775 RepID=A0ABS1R1D6_9SPHI|nr:thioredoxin family protein [Sphingobacterium faecale]MBL1408488.1 thioredoxin family protein [Sphingobacterium faecale]